MTVRTGKLTRRLLLSCIALGCLIGGALLCFQGTTSPTLPIQGWTPKEKAAYLDLLAQCPETECLTAWWHPEIRGVILEVSEDYQRSQLALQPESLVYTSPQIVHEGELPTSLTQSLLRLPGEADAVPVIPESKLPPPTEHDALFQQVSKCVSSREGVGVRGRFITIDVDGLLDALTQDKTPRDLFTEKERHCMSDLVKKGYYISFQEYENFPAL